MAQWGKRRMAGLARGLMIGLIIAVVIWVFFTTGVLSGWFENIPIGVGALLELDFWIYVGIIVFLVGMITLFIRSTINWGGA